MPLETAESYPARSRDAWVGLLNNGVWLKNARRANERARTLAEKLSDVLKVEPVFPREASAVFLRLPGVFVSKLHERGWHFYKFVEPDVYRFMCSWSVTESDIDDLVKDVKDIWATQGGAISDAFLIRNNEENL